MSARARELNDRYLDLMRRATDETVLGRVRDLWWEAYERDVDREGPYPAVDRLDVYMDKGRTKLIEMATKYAAERAGDADTAKIVQLTAQFLKSNTGKMFERFVGLATAYALFREDAPYCVVPFVDEFIPCCPGLSRDDFGFMLSLGSEKLSSHIDADLLAFDAERPDHDVFMLSIKSTLKDRFHNVPFWNLLRRAAVSKTSFPEITAHNPEVLSRVRYIAICSDLAAEQPDFASETGARKLLRIDAGLLDGAFVTASRAQGLRDEANPLGPKRAAAFHRLSSWIRHLSNPQP